MSPMLAGGRAGEGRDPGEPGGRMRLWVLGEVMAINKS
jgi:hypothetical protein